MIRFPDKKVDQLHALKLNFLKHTLKSFSLSFRINALQLQIIKQATHSYANPKFGQYLIHGAFSLISARQPCHANEA